MWLLIIFILLVKDLIDCSNVSNTAKKRAKLKTGSVSRRTIVKLCQYVVIVAKSENIRDENFRNPELLEFDKNKLKVGKSPIKDIIKVDENKMILLKTKMRSSL